MHRIGKMNIDDKIIEAFEMVGIYTDNLDYDELLEMDSLQFVSVIIALEETFMIRLSNDLENFDSLQTMNDFIRLVSYYFEEPCF